MSFCSMLLFLLQLHSLGDEMAFWFFLHLWISEIPCQFAYHNWQFRLVPRPPVDNNGRDPGVTVKPVVDGALAENQDSSLWIQRGHCQIEIKRQIYCNICHRLGKSHFMCRQPLLYFANQLNWHHHLASSPGIITQLHFVASHRHTLSHHTVTLCRITQGQLTVTSYHWQRLISVSKQTCTLQLAIGCRLRPTSSRKSISRCFESYRGNWSDQNVVLSVCTESLRAVPACSFYISNVAIFVPSNAMPRKSQQVCGSPSN